MTKRFNTIRQTGEIERKTGYPLMFTPLKVVLKLALFVCSILPASQLIEGASDYLPTDLSFKEDAEWQRQQVEGMMKGNVGKQPDGRTVFHADALRHYNLIFTRGFGYIDENAGNLTQPPDAKGFLEYLLAGQRADGCIPDRVNSAGRPIYSPDGEANRLADHALDNASFPASAVCRYVFNSGDLDFFREAEPARPSRSGLREVHPKG